MKISKISNILLSDIVVNPLQPRKNFNDDTLLELAESIALHGLIQPIVVRETAENSFELVAGERRFRAFELLGETEIPAIVKDINLQDSGILAMIENIQRDDLHFIEEAKGYKNLLQSYGWKQEELSSMVGKNQSTIANKLRLLVLPDSILDKILEYGFTERHSRALLSLKTEKQLLKAIEHIRSKQLNVSQTDVYVKKLIEKEMFSTNKKIQKKPVIKRYIKDIRLFTNTIKQAVNSINRVGVDATYDVVEESDQYTITIHIPIERSL